MANPIAIATFVLGSLLFLLGLFETVRHRKLAGALLLVGLGTAATPWLVSWYLAS